MSQKFLCPRDLGILMTCYGSQTEPAVLLRDSGSSSQTLQAEMC
jgi:hypothetical protein